MLVNELAGLPTPVTLVVDDYHLISSRDILQCVAFLVEHLPPALRLVLSARADPDGRRHWAAPSSWQSRP